jgi:peptide/nickel transport system permease protein
VRRDYPVIQSVNIFLATMILLMNFAVDMSYAYLDPRIRLR